MSNFTYNPPPGDKFLLALKKMFIAEKKQEIKNILDNCVSLDISTNGQFSHGRWNEYEAYANFRTDFDTIAKVTDKIRKDICAKCNTLMPEECGLGIVSVDFSPSLDLVSDTDSAENIIKEIADLADQSDSRLIRNLLDDELVEKGRELSQVYHLLFIVENSLRRFIDKILSEALGLDYFDKISMNQDIKSSIKSRKTQENKNKWLRVRGDSNIFYLDFIDLSYVIMNNWIHFKKYFPDQAWIQVKIEELYNCRCLIAHNSDIGDHEVSVIRTNYKSILLQISKIANDDLPF